MPPVTPFIVRPLEGHPKPKSPSSPWTDQTLTQALLVSFLHSSSAHSCKYHVSKSVDHTEYAPGEGKKKIEKQYHHVPTFRPTTHSEKHNKSQCIPVSQDVVTWYSRSHPLTPGIPKNNRALQTPPSTLSHTHHETPLGRKDVLFSRCFKITYRSFYCLKTNSEVNKTFSIA